MKTTVWVKTKGSLKSEIAIPFASDAEAREFIHGLKMFGFQLSYCRLEHGDWQVRIEE